jgi:hypothetical protein
VSRSIYFASCSDSYGLSRSSFTVAWVARFLARWQLAEGRSCYPLRTTAHDWTVLSEDAKTAWWGITSRRVQVLLVREVEEADTRRETKWDLSEEASGIQFGSQTERPGTFMRTIAGEDVRTSESRGKTNGRIPVRRKTSCLTRTAPGAVHLDPRPDLTRQTRTRRASISPTAHAVPSPIGSRSTCIWAKAISVQSAGWPLGHRPFWLMDALKLTNSLKP